MSELSTLLVERRSQAGTITARRLRYEGKVPAIVYGHKQEPAMIAVDSAAFSALLRKGAHGLIELDMDGVKETVVIKDIQYDVYGVEILHVDFARAYRDERIRRELPIRVKGMIAGGVLEQPLVHIEIECPASLELEELAVNVADLKLGQSIHVKDLHLPEGVNAVTSGDLVVIHVVEPTAIDEEAAATTGAEPELIRREEKPADEA